MAASNCRRLRRPASLPGPRRSSAISAGRPPAGARLPFASATLEPPWNIVAAGVAAAIPAAILVARSKRIAGRPDTARDRPVARVVAAEPPRTAIGRAAPQTRHGSRRRSGRLERIVAIATAASLIALVVAFAHRPDRTTP